MGELGSMISDDLNTYQMPGGYTTNCMQINITQASNVMETYNAQGAFYTTNASNGYYSPDNALFPKLVILEEPFSRHRFRYQSERGSHGGMFGESTCYPNNNNNKKSYPTVKLENYDPSQKVLIRASLYTDTDPPNLHVHKLQGKSCDQDTGVCVLQLSEDGTCCFQGLGISFTAKKEVKDILYKRLLKNNQFSGGVAMDQEHLKEMADQMSKVMQTQMNTVRICFEAFYESSHKIIDQIFSKPVNNQRELKITRLSKCSGYCRGDDEVFLLCEKVNKKEIKVKFFEVEGGKETWSAYAVFSESDVHHQVAIVFKTPPYPDQNIDKPVTVLLQLIREKDNETSEPKEFTYKPNKRDPEHIDRKRKRVEDSYGGGDPSNSSGSQGRNYPDQFNTHGAQGGAYGGSPAFQSLFPSYQGPPGSSHRRLSPSFTSEGNSLEAIDDPSISPIYAISDNIEPLFEEIHSQVTFDGPASAGDIDVIFNSLSLDDRRVRKNRPAPGSSRPSLTAPGPALSTTGTPLTILEIVESLGQALRLFATTADPRSFLYPMRELMVKPDNNGDNALHLAVIHQSENRDLFQNFLSVLNTTSSGDSPSPINTTNNTFQTPLHLAVSLNKPSLVSLLVLNGADPFVRDNKGNTAVHLAVLKSSESLQILLNKQIYGSHNISWSGLNIRNFRGYTALHLAVELKAEVLVTRLVDAGADLNVGEGLSGKTPLHFAVESYPTMLPCLLKQMKIDVDQQDYVGNTALHYACLQQDRDLVFQLMQVEANPLIENYSTSDPTQLNGETPFSIANDNDEIREILSGQISPSLRRKISQSRKLPDMSMEPSSTSQILKSQDRQSFSSKINDDKPQHTAIDSGYDSGQVEEIPDDLLNRVCNILDPPHVGWQKLCEVLLGQSCIDAVKKFGGSSPTKYLFSKMEDKTTIQNVKHILEAADLQEAIQAIDDH